MRSIFSINIKKPDTWAILICWQSWGTSDKKELGAEDKPIHKYWLKLARTTEKHGTALVRMTYPPSKGTGK